MGQLHDPAAETSRERTPVPLEGWLDVRHELDDVAQEKKSENCRRETNVDLITARTGETGSLV